LADLHGRQFARRSDALEAVGFVVDCSTLRLLLVRAKLLLNRDLFPQLRSCFSWTSFIVLRYILCPISCIHDLFPGRLSHHRLLAISFFLNDVPRQYINQWFRILASHILFFPDAWHIFQVLVTVVVPLVDLLQMI
jgi:hypothetical protein